MFPLGFGLSESDVNQFRVFPNPSSDGKFTVDGLKGSTEKLRILSMHGQLLREESILGHLGQYQVNVDLPAGTYIVQLVDDKGQLFSYRQFLN
jgi:hypothetical protein